MATTPSEEQTRVLPAGDGVRDGAPAAAKGGSQDGRAEAPLRLAEGIELLLAQTLLLALVGHGRAS